MAALAANHLVRSHMQHNRKPAVVDESTSGIHDLIILFTFVYSDIASVSSLRKNSSMPELMGATKVST